MNVENSLSPAAIKAQTNRILASSGFSSSERMRSFLRFVVDTELIPGLDNDKLREWELWEHYYQQLVRIAAKRLPVNLRRTGDEEDIALVAFNSLCRGAEAGRFPNLADRDDLDRSG